MPRFNFRRGDTIKLRSQIFGSDKKPLDLTGCKVWFTLKYRVQDSDAAALAQVTTDSSVPVGGGVTILDAKNGQIGIRVPPAATSGLADQTWELPYDIQVKDPTEDIATAETGTIIIDADVTRAIT